MKKIILATVLLLACRLLNAQDLIYTKKEGIVKAKVTEITPRLIHYKKTENPEGPNYSIANRYVDSIIYENGSKEIFSYTGKRLSPKNINEIERYSALPNNLVSTGFDLSAFTLPTPFMSNNEDFTPYAGWFFSYERLLAKQKLGISISPFASWNRRYYGISASAPFYIKNKGKMRFGIGPHFNYSVQDEVFYYYNTSTSYGNSLRLHTKTYKSALAVNISILGNINERIFIDTDIFLGPVLSERPFTNNLPEEWRTYVRKNEEPMLGCRVGVGYRF